MLWWYLGLGLDESYTLFRIALVSPIAFTVVGGLGSALNLRDKELQNQLSILKGIASLLFGNVFVP